jgi:CBS domain containing-hemolysin-like protein
LERLVPPILAIIFSVTLILLFGEIIPQSLCARWGLSIGADSAWMVWILIGLTFPISWPISKLLDCVIGVDHQTYFKRAELKELVISQFPKKKNADYFSRFQN